MSNLQEAAQQALTALEIGYDSASVEAAQYHASMAGYKPHRHAEMDADVQKIARAITALRAALSAPAAPPGFKLVPVEPTVGMAQALLDYTDQDELHWPKHVSPNCALAAYRIMLAAAPQPQEQT